MEIRHVTEEEKQYEKVLKMNEVLRAENEQLRADLDYVSAMADIPLEVAE